MTVYVKQHWPDGSTVTNKPCPFLVDGACVVMQHHGTCDIANGANPPHECILRKAEYVWINLELVEKG